MTRRWWHPLPAAEEPDDDGLIVCPHCQQEGCAKCQWAGVIPAPEPESWCCPYCGKDFGPHPDPSPSSVACCGEVGHLTQEATQ